jgi:hypothetical protein
MVDPARGVVICRWVRRREPSSDLLLYVVPCGQVLALTIQTVGVRHYGHLISLTSGRTTVQCKVSNWSDRVRTHHSLSYGHWDIFLYEAI